MNGFQSDVINLLSDNGWYFLRHGKGSHDIWKGPTGKKVPVSHNCKSRHTANEIMKQAGIKYKF